MNDHNSRFPSYERTCSVYSIELHELLIGARLNEFIWTLYKRKTSDLLLFHLTYPSVLVNISSYKIFRPNFVLLRELCGYPVLYFHFAYNFCVEFRTCGLCKRSGWRDVMPAARLAFRGTCGDYELNLRLLYF